MLLGAGGNWSALEGLEPAGIWPRSLKMGSVWVPGNSEPQDPKTRTHSAVKQGLETAHVRSQHLRAEAGGSLLV